MQSFDCAVIGGGIVGLSVAWALLEKNPAARMAILEKEDSLGRHQTGRNSGVIHSGIYYKPGSLKAVNCREGRKALIEFCQQEGIAHEICGKVIVAVDDSEMPALERIYDRGQANGVTCEMIGAERLHELEPHAAGIRAIHVPDAGIVDYKGVCAKLADHIKQSGGTILTSSRVTGIHAVGDRTRLASTAGDISAK